MGRPALEVADIFRAHGPAWRRASARAPEPGPAQGHVGHRAVPQRGAGRPCAALRGCAQAQIAYNSCRNRHCPKCQAQRRAALARGAPGRSAAGRVLPRGLHAAGADQPTSPTTNKAVIYGLLFDVAAETLRTIAADPKHLGARIGATLVLHTWGSALTHHPHVHGIVPGGGLSPDGERWVACRPGFFLPVRVLSRLFRRRFLEELAARCIAPGSCSSSASTPRSPTPTPSPTGSRRCASANGWSMPSARSPDPQAVLAYLSRYTHRVAISNQRLARPGRARRHLPLEGLPRQGHARATRP